ncbi:ComF family protein [Denitratisoma sp. agr-D3]
MSNNRMLGAGIFHRLDRSFLRRAATWASALLPAQYCLLCRAPSGDGLLCEPCRAALPPLPAPACPVCALPVPGAQGGTPSENLGGPCGACLAHPPAYDRTVALWRYDFPVDALIQSLKYGHQLAVGHFLGEALADRARRAPPQPRPDLVLPMPLSPGHLRQRGFNQALEIARPLARALDVALVPDACQRLRETQPQAGLAWKERQSNIRGAFACPQDLSGRHVLVVDDVMTSGATLGELARTLKKHGAASVANWVCARALKH